MNSEKFVISEAIPYNIMLLLVLLTLAGSWQKVNIFRQK